MVRTIRLWVAGLAMLLAGMVHAQDLVGNWQGTLEAAQGLRIVLKIGKDDGRYKAVMYSIDQGGDPIAVSAITLSGAAVNFSIKDLKLAYVGTLNPDGNTISGKSTQSRETDVLNLTKVTDENLWPIPQPMKPMAKDAKPGFEVATIKPSKPDTQGKYIDLDGRHLIAVNYNLYDMLGDAYGLHRKQVMGAPEWFDSELFDIDGVPDVEGAPNDAQIGMMLQGLLTDRFHLKFHREQREMAVYTIEIGKGGAKIKKSEAGPDDQDNFEFGKLGSLAVRNITMAYFAQEMQASVMDRPVVDQTGLKGQYDFTLKWTPDDSQFAQFRSAGMSPKTTAKPNGPPGLYTAMQEQLGLKMQPGKATVEVIVIERVEQPSPN